MFDLTVVISPGAMCIGKGKDDVVMSSRRRSLYAAILLAPGLDETIGDALASSPRMLIGSLSRSAPCSGGDYYSFCAC